MKEQVLSIEQMKELIDMGFDISKASMCWIGCSDENGVLPYSSTFKEIFNKHLDTIPKVLTPTFTLQDILNILPKCIKTENVIYTLFLCPNDLYDGYIVAYMDASNELTHLNGSSQYSSVSFLEAAFNMLKWCKKNNYIK